MGSYFVTIFLILSITSCQYQQSVVDKTHISTNMNSNLEADTKRQNPREPELVEFFSDESEIGLHRKNKVEIYNYREQDEDIKTNHLAVIKFYSLNEEKAWKLKQSFEFEKDDLLDLDPQIKDFNNDGFNDVTYVSKVAARGANEVRNLFIYDKNKDELIYIKNSEDYPNMLYNKELNCIDSFMVHGGSTTVFLNLDGDMLKEFASVDNGTHRTVYVIDKNGKENILQKKKISENDIYVRYKTFNPPKEY